MQENKGEASFTFLQQLTPQKPVVSCGVEGFKQFGIDLIVVAVPGLPIKPGWTHDAALLGLNLTSNASNRALAQCRIDPLLHGFVVTTQKYMLTTF